MSPSTSSQHTVTMRSPGEIVSAVPFLLGFAPEDSLVLIALDDKRIVLTCRVDLDDVTDPHCTVAILVALRHAGATGVLLVGYADSRFATAPALARVTELLEAAGLPVREQISVVDGRWFHERCTEAQCCSQDGMAVVDHDTAPSTLALATMTEGYRPDRAAVVAECRSDRPLLTAAIGSELDRGIREDDLGDDAVAADICAVLGWGTSTPATATQRAKAALCSVEPGVRDVWYALVAPGVLGDFTPGDRALHEIVVRAGRDAGDLGSDGILLDPQARDRVLARALDWARSLPDDRPSVTVFPLVIVAAAHLCAGDGARARALVERAWELDTPQPTMLENLAGCLQAGFRPPGFGRLSRDFEDRGRRIA